MAGHGGARNRSGPPKQEGSARADRAGYSLTALPAEGYDGPIPDFPLPDATDRELTVWNQAWRTPQACAWSMPSEQWRIETVAMWVRVKVACEDPGVTPPRLGQLHRFADQIGMTTAGLAEMGWKVAVDELAERRSDAPAEEKADEEPPSRRLRSAGDAKS